MFITDHIDELAKKLFSILPTSIQSVEKEIEQKFKEALQSAFNHMNLITREEFDIQIKVLNRTREKLEQLQQQIDNLIANNSQKT